MRVTFTRAGFWRGARRVTPMMLGLIPFGLVVGVIADGKGLSQPELAVMSALVFAGASQLLALEFWTDPPDLFAVAVAAFVVNVRMVPYGAALSFWMDGLRGWRLWTTLFVTVDHSVPLAVLEQRQGGRDAAFMLGVGVVSWAAWILATAAGHALGNAVAVPPGHWLFFAATAGFVAILVPLWRGVRRDLAPWAVAAGVALVAAALRVPSPIPLLAGALAGAALAAWRDTRGHGKRKGEKPA
ncbi:AzlC family ABC transporter permease [Roseomonas sp. CCTCC AB2023176]|uniref:AzlC family ABC transporter permease n=1 Tax=Roseomonas sp. CCTCC AB2023176 TaxID=3342640 RepID=UPI0035DAFF72